MTEGRSGIGQHGVMRFWSIDMHFRTARETWSPTDLHRAQQNTALPMNRERDYLLAKIREHESEIARRAEQIRLLRLELESASVPLDFTTENRRAGSER
jgi:hypothetical protein